MKGGGHVSSARMIVHLSLRPYPEDGTVCMRENNWEYARDSSAGTGQWYAAERGEAYLSYWENGIGLVSNGTVDTHWRAMRDLEPTAPPHVAVELGVAYAYSTS